VSRNGIIITKSLITVAKTKDRKTRTRKMKKRKNIYIILLLTALIFSMTACGGTNAQIKDIQDRGTLRVGAKVDVPRFGYLNPATNEMEGLEIDIARIIAKDIIGDENAVSFFNITAQTRGPMLDNGEIDIVIATFTITEERKETFNFSRPYFTDELGYLVLSGSAVTKPEDLKGKNIGVVQSSTAKAALEEEIVNLGLGATIREYASYPEVKAGLNAGEVDAFVADKSILFGYLDENARLLDAGFNPQNYGIATKKANDKLAAHIDSIIEKLEETGELAALIEKWGL